MVPCLFTTRLDAVFALPKLAALWVVLAISLTVVAGGVLMSGRTTRGTRWLWTVDVAAATFLVLNVAAWVFSTDRHQSLYGERLQYQGLLTVLLYLGFFYLARLSLTDARRMTRVFFAIVIGAALVAGYALVQKAGLDPIWTGYLPGGRVFSSIGQPNALAAYLVLAIPVSASLLHQTKGVLRSGLVLAVAAIAAALLFTLSRGGYLGLTVTLSVMAVGWQLRTGARERRVPYTLAVVLVAGIAVVVLAPPARTMMTDLWGRVVSSRDFSRDLSVRTHLDIWRVAAHIAVEHPAIGTGQETFPDVFPGYSHSVLPRDRASYLDAFRVESPHNVYLGIAAGAGFPALAAYAGIIAGFAYAVLRAARTARSKEVSVVLLSVFAAAVGHVVTDTFMTADITSTWLFWILMGAGIGFASTRSSRVQIAREGQGTSAALVATNHARG